MLPLSWSLDHDGPMAQTAEDAAIILNTIAGFDAEDPYSLNSPVPDHTSFLNGDVSGVRIGVLSGNIRQPVDREIEDSLIDVLHILENLGMELHEKIDISRLELARKANNTILMAEAAHIHERWLPREREHYGEDVLYRLDSGALLPATHYFQALKMGRELRQELLSALDYVDVLFAPMIPMSAPSISDAQSRSTEAYGPYDDLRSALTHFCGAFNLTGLPAISIPCGFNSDGLPIGFQLIGRPLGEGALLQIAGAYEQCTDWKDIRPDLNPI
jgi:aspartyl-tRNA(Asn)/glutamyl-tRNA(Gln) amidotransferase subunit A